MNRRTFLSSGLSILGIASISSNVFAAQARASASPEVYRQVGPFADDNNTAYVFFSYECEFCRKTTSAFDAWIATVPKKFKVEKIPLASKDRIAQAAALYAATTLNVTKRAQFEAYVYSRIQERGMSYSDPLIYLLSAQDAGYDRNQFYMAMSSEGAKGFLNKVVKINRRYAIEYTPSVAIAGRYMVDAERVGGSYENMFKVMNGLVSQHLRG